MGVYLIGCLHLGHENMAIKHRGWKCSEDHDNHLIEQWNKRIHKKDLVFILGDVTMETDKFYYKLALLKGRKRVVLGNHDLGKHIPKLLNYVEDVSGMIHYKGFWLTHAPVHPQELSWTRGNIHAHVHSQPIFDSSVDVNYWDKKETIVSGTNNLYYNVDAHLIGYTPISFDEILEIHNNRK